jgi:hypothetical protein
VTDLDSADVPTVDAAPLPPAHPAEYVRTCVVELGRRLAAFVLKLPDHYDPDVYERVLRSLTALSRMIDKQYGPSLPPKTLLSGADQQREDDALRAKLEDAVASVCRAGPGEEGDRQADGGAAPGPGVDAQ